MDGLFLLLASLGVLALSIVALVSAVRGYHAAMDRGRGYWAYGEARGPTRPLLPRWVARLVAFIGGYFWLPCPRCGRMFAGFERHGTPLPTPGSAWGSRASCRRCVVSASRLEREEAAAWPGRFEDAWVDDAMRSAGSL